MHTLKFSLLFSLLLFGAYSKYKAETDVKKIISGREKQTSSSNDIRNEDIGFMEHAIRLSRHALNHDNVFGSVVVKDGKIVGEGWTKINQRHDPSAHAVVEAIRDASMNLSSDKLPGCYLYTNARPCSMCLSLIYLTGIEKIYYSVREKQVNAWESDSDASWDLHELVVPSKGRQIPAIPIHTRNPLNQ